MQSDFKKIIEALGKKNKINPSIAQCCSNAFERNWPHLATLLIDFLSKRRHKEVKTFLSEVQEHIAKGKIGYMSNKEKHIV